MSGLGRFLKAQDSFYQIALEEIKQGKKCSHWMWFIFPQIKGLGKSATAEYYAIKNRAEAEEYLSHPILGARLVEISKALLKLKTNNAYEVFGYPDFLKLQSSMTLFYIISRDDVYRLVLEKFFDGNLDAFTVNAIR